MGYLHEVDQWLDEQFADFAAGVMVFPELKRVIREKILESYRNGAQTPSPAPRKPSNGRSERTPRAKRKPQQFAGHWSCANCGTAITLLPFEPKGSTAKSLLCAACYKTMKNEQ